MVRLYKEKAYKRDICRKSFQVDSREMIIKKSESCLSLFTG